jgi:hypothetical protein
VNGKFTSAPFMVNAIAAALEAADLPLDDRQAGKIDAIARDTMAKDERRLAGYGDGTFALQRILDEAELKGAFFRDVFAVLSEAQATALSPASVRNRVRLDLFSSAMVFGPHIDAFTFRDEEELATRLRDRVAKSLKFTDDQRTALDPVVRRWAAACPRDLLFMTWGVLDERGMVTAARAEAWGREFLKLFTTLAGEPGLSAPQRAAFRGVGNILVPLDVDRRES